MTTNANLPRLTDHQRAAVLHLAAVRQYGQQRDTRTREIGLPTSRALQRAELLEVQGQLVSVCRGYGRTRTQYDEVGRLTLQGWRVARQLGADVRRPLARAIRSAEHRAELWSADRPGTPANADEAARCRAEAAELRAVAAELLA
jgi:hypothetical protein